MASGSGTGTPARPNTKDVVITYVKGRLREAGYDGNRAQILRSLQSRFDESDLPAVRQIREFECHMMLDTEHRNHIHNAAEGISGCNSQVARDQYNGVLNEMFVDHRVNWGRLSVIIIFTSELAIIAMRRCNSSRIVELIDWCTCYFRAHFFDEWIAASGGWMAMPAHFRGATGGGFGRILPALAQYNDVMMPSLFLALGMIGGMMAVSYNILFRSSK